MEGRCEKAKYGKPRASLPANQPCVLFSVVDLVSADLEEVAQKCGLSYKALVALRWVLLAQFLAFPFNGADLYEELKTSTAILSTGVGRFVCVLGAEESDDKLGHHKGLWTVWPSLFP
ncbi:Dna Repair Protein Rad51-like 4 [Manis pentadactyla]|nr:Dna Repair Protein Rad51-like 4 [Manis pentadactyla]